MICIVMLREWRFYWINANNLPLQAICKTGEIFRDSWSLVMISSSSITPPNHTGPNFHSIMFQFLHSTNTRITCAQARIIWCISANSLVRMYSGNDLKGDSTWGDSIWTVTISKWKSSYVTVVVLVHVTLRVNRVCLFAHYQGTNKIHWYWSQTMCK